MKQIKMVIPKGRISSKVLALLNDAGLGISMDDRQYIPVVKDREIAAKVMKPQNIPQLVELGSHDIGFTGRDWILETGADVEVIMELGFNPVSIVAAVPESFDENALKQKKIVVASEYSNIAETWLKNQGYQFNLLRTYGATEVFPPEDADMIIDNTSTGRTLMEHKLKILDTLMVSSTVFIANRQSVRRPEVREKLNNLKLLFQSILESRNRVMLEMNVSNENFETVLNSVPAMKSPTVAPLYGDSGYSIKVAVPREDSPSLILKLRKLGAGDILEYEMKKVVI